MKKGYIPPYSFGALEGSSESLQAAAKVTMQSGTDLAAIFYATAFQAGIDELVVPETMTTDVVAQSAFLAARTKGIPLTRCAPYILVETAFSAHLPDGWLLRDDFSFARFLYWFVADLLIATSEGASILHLSLRHSVPTLEKAESLLLSELFVPLRNLFAAITCVEPSSPVPQKSISTDDIQRFNAIISSDLFNRYSASQSSLDDSTIPLTTALPVVVSAGQKLFSQNNSLLALKRVSVSILEVTPKLVDAVFGKIPGVLAEVVAKLSISLLESRRRVVIYDFQEPIKGIIHSNFARMLKGAEPD